MPKQVEAIPTAVPSFKACKAEPGAGRRAFTKAALVGLAGGTVPFAATHAANTPDTVSNPDAALIATCREHVTNVRAYNERGNMEDDEDPYWAAYNATRNAISKAKPITPDGMLAKAWAAKAEAALSGGGEDVSGGLAKDWAWDLVDDLLRLAGRA